VTHLRLIRLWRGNLWKLFLIVVIRLGVAATWIVQALASAKIFALLFDSTRDSLAPNAFLTPSTLLAAALCARPALVLGGQLVAHSAMTAVKRELRIRVLRTVVPRSAWDPRGRSGRDHALLVDGIENLDAYLSGYIPQLIVAVLAVGVIGGAMVAINPVAGVVVSLVGLCVPIVPRLWGRILAGRGESQWNAYQDLQAEFVDSMHGMTTLVAFGAEVRRERQLATASAALLRSTIAQLRLSLVDSGLAAMALVGAPASVLIVLVLQRGAPSSAVVFTLVLLAIELVRPLRDLASMWHAGYVGTFSGAAIVALLANDHSTEVHTEPPHHASVHQLRLCNIVVKYPGFDDPALTVDQLRFSPGLTVIVGPSGAGKSTLGATVVGLAIPESGTVVVDGVEFAPRQLLRIVSLVPQDPALFGGTVAEEIARGAGGVDASSIAAAAAAAGIGSDDLTLSLSSVVGEGGALLSGGQRQRVAIARALAQQRQILVLDEATSALDPASEASLIERLHSDRSRIVIAITHRMAVAEVADCVVTVENGRVVSPLPSENADAVMPS